MKGNQIKFKVIILLGVFQLSQIALGAVTQEQLAQAQGVIRQACMGKAKITEDLAESIGKGNAPDDKNGKCYVHCVFEMVNGMKRAKVTADSFFKQCDTLMPDEIRAEVKDVFAQCKDSAQGVKDPCEAATALFKCLSGIAGDRMVFA